MTLKRKQSCSLFRAVELSCEHARSQNKGYLTKPSLVFLPVPPMLTLQPAMDLPDQHQPYWRFIPADNIRTCLRTRKWHSGSWTPLRVGCHNGHFLPPPLGNLVGFFFKKMTIEYCYIEVTVWQYKSFSSTFLAVGQRPAW